MHGFTEKKNKEINKNKSLLSVRLKLSTKGFCRQRSLANSLLFKVSMFLPYLFLMKKFAHHPLILLL